MRSIARPIHQRCLFRRHGYTVAREVRQDFGYSAATANDPRLMALRDKVRLDFQDGWPQAAAEIEVALTDGSVRRASHDAGIPSADIAAQGERLAAKFDALAEPVLGAARARELRRAIEGLDTLADAGEIARLAAE